MVVATKSIREKVNQPIMSTYKAGRVVDIGNGDLKIVTTEHQRLGAAS